MYLSAVWQGNDLYFDRDGMIFFEFDGGGSAYFEFNYTGVYNRATDTYTFDCEHTFIIPENITPSKENFRFIGWCESQDGNNTIYQPGDTLTVKNAYGMSLYAVFQSDDGVIAIECIGRGQTKIISAVDSYGDVSFSNGLTLDKIKLVVDELADNQKTSVIAAINEVTSLEDSTEGEDYVMLDISLKDENGNPVHIEEGRLKVFMNYPKGLENAKDYDFTVYHYKDGVAVPLTVYKENDRLYFFVDSFSPYVLVWSKPKENSGSEGGTTTESGKDDEGGTATESGKDDEGGTATESGKDNEGGNKGTTNDTPATGDGFQPGIWFAVMSMAMIVALGLIAWKKDLLSVLLHNAK